MLFGRIDPFAARRGHPPRRALALLLTTALLAACSSAPVGPGFYRVEKGDTLSAIARRNGQSVASLSRWNGIANPNQLEVDQVLRVAPPGGEAGVRTRAVDTATPAEAAVDAPARAGSARAARPAAPPPLASGGPPAGTTITLAWPARGTVVDAFDGSRNKGIDIGGQPGDPVTAAAAGQVAYVGQLRGYGNLVIIKHSGGFLTSYAHLQRANVKEGQAISSGQTIATLGDTEASRPILHFELRYNGQPVNPVRYLPSR
ncbi:peptidoglycan DD-metalloendopeptidase family protein [Robbsia sp. Bb-Pol-6]|uniref:Peptidoglycan DD-metalloendopeptidase family protein n=1 Tax=Robbsia betulipollinis TaxID=2981849 RepID=A0ABT3ZPZ4_9BURK|nr:peptidoglycan DD-metalloendopeptidase family protein [Robbsia betulipollinis]MCY0388477.1 peptidoglycan DD-metalloendopeptidase family protein [Robbsia betulipollinis]